MIGIDTFSFLECSDTVGLVIDRHLAKSPSLVYLRIMCFDGVSIINTSAG